MPIVGGIMVGLMARYGSEKIRGHGIPEALESILINGAQISPRVALFKPLSAQLPSALADPSAPKAPSS